MRIVAESLAQNLKGSAPSAWLVSGDEPLLVGESADLIRARARQDGFVGREVLFVDRHFDWDSLDGALRAMSLFAEKRIIELRMAQPKPGVDGSKILQAAVKDPATDVCLLVITDKIEWKDHASSWVKAFETQGHWVQADQLGIDQLPGWIKGRLSRAGLVAEPEAIELLAERCEGNLVAAHQQIERLSLLTAKGTVSVEAMAESVAMSARYNVFQLSEALLMGDAGRVLRMLDGLQGEGVEPTLVLWCIAEELRSILQWTPNGGPRRLYRGGRARKDLLSRAHARVPRGQLQSLLEDAARIDGYIKGSRKDEAWGALARLATTLCLAAQRVATR
jgi:DNA polymerase-3 subunit delta